jgi:hypothetical protein
MNTHHRGDQNGLADSIQNHPDRALSVTTAASIGCPFTTVNTHHSQDYRDITA